MQTHVSIGQLAKEFEVSKITIRRWWAQGYLPPPLRLGKRLIRWNRAEVIEWVQRLHQQQQQEEHDHNAVS